MSSTTPDLITQVAQPAENGVELIPLGQGGPSGTGDSGSGGYFASAQVAPEPHGAMMADGRMAQQYERTPLRIKFARICCFCFGFRRKPGTVHTDLPALDQRLIPKALQGPDGSLVRESLLPPLLPEDKGKKTLVLDLDETLVHSSFVPMPSPDYVIPVEIDDQVHKVYVAKRPHVDEFMKRVGEKFEVVVFTASLAKYADPVLNLLDVHDVVRARLFRSACVNHIGNYVKDLSCLGRDLKDVIIIDNSPASYMFHPENAIPVGSWFADINDTELLDLIPFLEAMTKYMSITLLLTIDRVDDVSTVLDDKL